MSNSKVTLEDRGPSGGPIDQETYEAIMEAGNKAICQVKWKGHCGTGFLCCFPAEQKRTKMAAGLFTNNHVMPKSSTFPSDFPAGLEIVFTKIKGLSSMKLQKEAINLFWTDKELDATFIELTYEVVFRWITCGARFLEVGQAVEGEQVIVYQCPTGKLAIASGLISKIDHAKGRLSHNAGTDFGSSGSPLLNLQTQAIAIHFGFASESKYGYDLTKIIQLIEGKMLPEASMLDVKKKTYLVFTNTSIYRALIKYNIETI